MFPVKKPVFIVYLLLGFIAAFFTRLPHIDRASFWQDEILQMRTTSGRFGKIWSQSPSDKPPLDYYIQWFFMKKDAPTSEARARLHACIIGSAAVAALGWWAWKMGGSALGLIVLILALGNPLMARYSQEGRPYALMLFSESLFLGAFWSVAKSPAPPRPRQMSFLIFTMAICLWSLYWTGLVCFAALLFGAGWFLMKKEHPYKPREMFAQKRQWLFPAALLLLTLLSMIPLMQRGAGATQTQYYAPFDAASWERARLYLDIFALGYDWWQYVAGSGWALLALMAIGLAGWIIRRDKRPAALFCFFLFTVFFAGMFGFYYAINHWMEERYVLAALPAALALAAMGIETLGWITGVIVRRFFKKPAPAAATSAALFLGALCLGAGLYYILAYPVNRADWRGFFQRLAREEHKNKIVVVGTEADFLVAPYYQNIFCGTNTVIKTDFDDTKTLENILRSRGNHLIVLPSYIETAHIQNLRYRQILENGMHKEAPQFWGLSIWQKHSARIETAPLGNSNPHLIIFPGKEKCPYLGMGWSGREIWEGKALRAMDGKEGFFFFTLENAQPLAVSVRVFPYNQAMNPALQLNLMVNDTLLTSRTLHQGWQDIAWEIEPEALFSGVNEARILSSRTQSPQRLDPLDADTRELSIWVEQIEMKTME